MIQTFLNPLMKSLGLPSMEGVYWLQLPRPAFLSILVACLFRSPGPAIVILSSAMSVIPGIYYEVANMDGASSWKKFRYITFPLIKPALLVVVILNTISSFQTFSEIYFLTNEGPGSSTAFLLTRIYKEAFLSNNMGPACALTVILISLLTAMVGLEYLILRTDRHIHY